MIRGNSTALLFFQNGEAVSHFLKFFPGLVASFLLMNTPLTRHKWGHSGAALSYTLQQAQPRCAPWRVTELQGFPQSLPCGEKGWTPGVTKSKLAFLVHSPTTLLPRQSISKHRGPGRNPKAWMISDWSVTSHELAEKSFLSTGRKRMEIKLFSK